MAKNNWILDYYQRIKNGSETVDKWILLIFTLIVQGIESGRYIFDAVKANHAIEWIETHCFHSEGPLAPGPLVLNVWQKAIVSSIFGLLDPETGKRQFREILLVVARKNGKSVLAGAIAKYVWYEEGGYGAKIFCTAPKLDQADIIYDGIWQMTIIDPEWQAEEEAIRGSIVGHQKKTYDDSGHARRRMRDLYIPATNSSVKKVAFSAKKSDGFNPSLVVCDEIASWQGDAGLKQYEVWKSAGGAREMGDQPALILSCSTAGYVNDSIYDELVKRATRFLLGDSKESRLLPFLYMIDELEKWNDINELRKSNPNLGVSVSVDYLLEEIAIAEGSLSKRTEFITKYCNIKQNSSQAWLEFEVVEKCMDGHHELDEFRGCYCVGGIDLSQAVDLTSACIVVEKQGRLYVVSHFWMPESRIETATAEDNMPYRTYLERGLLSLSGENYVNYEDVFQWFKSMVENYEILPLQIGYDKYSAQYLISELTAYGFHCDDVYQGFNLAPVIRETEGLLKDGRISFGDNSLLQAHFLNTALKQDNGSLRVRMIKLGNRTRIDGAAAVIDAMTVRQKWYGEIGEQLRNEG